MNTITNTYENRLNQFIQSLKQTIETTADALTRHGKELVAMLELNPSVFEDILKHCPQLNLAFLETLERIGRNKLDARLITYNSPVASRVIASGMPIEQQRQLIDVGVPVVHRDNGGFKVEIKKLSRMSASEGTYVVGPELIGEQAQIEIITGREKKKQRQDARYLINGDHITFLKNSEYTYAQLMDIAKKIEPKAIDIEASIKERQIVK